MAFIKFIILVIIIVSYNSHIKEKVSSIQDKITDINNNNNKVLKSFDTKLNLIYSNLEHIQSSLNILVKNKNNNSEILINNLFNQYYDIEKENKDKWFLENNKLKEYFNKNNEDKKNTDIYIDILLIVIIVETIYLCHSFIEDKKNNATWLKYEKNTINNSLV